MALFRCLVRGDNFPGGLIGEAGLIGFYTTRFVDAESAEQAESLVLKNLRSDPELNVSQERRVKEAKVFFEEIEAVPDETERKPNRGFTFFPMEA